MSAHALPCHGSCSTSPKPSRTRYPQSSTLRITSASFERVSVASLVSIHFRSGRLQKWSLSLCLNYFDPDPIQKCKERYSVPGSWDIRCHATCVASHQHRLFSKAKGHDEASSIDELEQLCQVLRTHIQLNQLRLSFACDVADIEIAEEVLRPVSQLPHLRECPILLGFQHSPTDTEHIPLLQELAKIHVTQLINPSIPTTFDFTALPPEIQLQILSYTPLVTPYNLVWSLNTLVSTSTQSPFYEPRTFPYRSYPSIPECCLTCSPSPSPAPKPNICACWSKHTAFSSACTCWRFPLSLFRVIKSVKEMAESLFYGRNHFWVLPRGWNTSRKLEIWIFFDAGRGGEETYEEFGVGDELECEGGVGWLVNLFLICERLFRISEVNIDLPSLHEGDETYGQWLATLEFLRAMPPGQLTLTIDTKFPQSEIYSANGGWEYGDSGMVVPDSVYIAEAEHTFSISQALAQDLFKDEVKPKLFWHFTWPRIGGWQGEGGVGLGNAREGEEKARDKGRVLEKMVMGPLYEGEERGKYERREEWNWYRDY